MCVDPLKTNIVPLYFTKGFNRTSISPSITFQQLKRKPCNHGNNNYIVSWHIPYIMCPNARVCSVVIFVCKWEVSQFPAPLLSKYEYEESHDTLLVKWTLGLPVCLQLTRNTTGHDLIFHNETEGIFASKGSRTVLHNEFNTETNTEIFSGTWT